MSPTHSSAWSYLCLAVFSLDPQAWTHSGQLCLCFVYTFLICFYWNNFCDSHVLPKKQRCFRYLLSSDFSNRSLWNTTCRNFICTEYYLFSGISLYVFPNIVGCPVRLRNWIRKKAWKRKYCSHDKHRPRSHLANITRGYSAIFLHLYSASDTSDTDVI